MFTSILTMIEFFVLMVIVLIVVTTAVLSAWVIGRAVGCGLRWLIRSEIAKMKP